jgi:hypothetical protein
MAFIVLRTPAAREVVDRMSKRERRAYDTVVDALAAAAIYTLG